MSFGLPEKPPGNKDGVQCNICINQCRIGEGEKGYCGLRDNRNGRLRHLAGTPERGLVSWYYDPLPTNCVADWVCPGGSSSGHPRYSFSRGPEYGYENLAVFYEACSFNCLFCQNWHFRAGKPGGATKSARELAAAVTKTTSCICYFGGDPTPQLDHALAASRLALENAKGRILRICWETNGSMNGSLLKKMARLSMESGGCIKFDLKAFDSNLHRALTNSSNKQTLDNFKQLAEISRQRADPPFLIASTLLVPGYVDPREVSRIATFIASLDRTIPYTLLAFYPHFYMNDLPRTSRSHAEESLEAAGEAGLERVKVGNLHLLSENY
jgi:pyruvate formate lyase activating enzyme